MGELVPLSAPNRDVFIDGRGEGRVLRASWHPSEGMVVLSLWEWDHCRATFRLAPDDVPDLIALLASGLPERSGAAEPAGPFGPPGLPGGFPPPAPGGPLDMFGPSGPPPGPPMGPPPMEPSMGPPPMEPPMGPPPVAFPPVPPNRFTDPDAFPERFDQPPGMLELGGAGMAGAGMAGAGMADQPDRPLAGPPPDQAPFFTEGGFHSELPPPPAGYDAHPAAEGPAGQHGGPPPWHPDFDQPAPGPWSAPPDQSWADPRPPSGPAGPGDHPGLPPRYEPTRPVDVDPYAPAPPDFPPRHAPPGPLDGWDHPDAPPAPHHDQLGPRTGYDLPAAHQLAQQPYEPPQQPYGPGPQPGSDPGDRWPVPPPRSTGPEPLGGGSWSTPGGSAWDNEPAAADQPRHEELEPTQYHPAPDFDSAPDYPPAPVDGSGADGFGAERFRHDGFGGHGNGVGNQADDARPPQFTPADPGRHHDDRYLDEGYRARP